MSVTGASEMRIMTKQVVVKEGLVERMTLPAGWSENNESREEFWREFSPPDREDVKLVFFYRGKRVHREAATNFLKVLNLPEHELTMEERRNVEWIIRNASEPEWFAIKSLRTEGVNQKKALVMEGLWLKKRQANLGLFFDSDQTGSNVQEIHYVAPEEDYYKFLPDAINAIKSIVWNEE
jgi:hypothetical protein